MGAKEHCIVAKEPHVVAKEPHVEAKELRTHTSIPSHQKAVPPIDVFQWSFPHYWVESAIFRENKNAVHWQMWGGYDY